ncbi:MAG: hypothetical protein EOP15_18385, partial [Pseudomonas sp.]
MPAGICQAGTKLARQDLQAEFSLRFFNVHEHIFTNFSFASQPPSSLQQEHVARCRRVPGDLPTPLLALESVMTSAANSAPLIEKHTIGYVPPQDRHGKVR